MTNDRIAMKSEQTPRHYSSGIPMGMALNYSCPVCHSTWDG